MKPEDLRDRETFHLVYQACHGSIFRFVLAMTGDRLTAAEITQDVFVWLIDHTDRFDPARGDLQSFLLGVARKLLLRRNQAAWRWAELNESLPQPEPDEPAADVEELRRAIAALPQQYREVVVLCDLEDCSYEEAAAALDCAVGTIKSRLNRARQFLARKLESARRAPVPEGFAR
jgi:RNA polymerase sigma-70 factor (ECF subfamily)